MRALAFSHLARTTFCWLPPDRFRQSVLMVGVLILRRSTQLFGDAPFLPGVDQAIAGERCEIGERDVGGDRQEQHQTFDAPLAGNVAEAEIDRLGRRRQLHALAADPQRAAVMRRKSGQRAGQFLASRADHAGDSENLAGMELEAHVPVGVAERRVSRPRARRSSRYGFCSGSR